MRQDVQQEIIAERIWTSGTEQMAIRILGTSHELTLIFDRSSVRLSKAQIESLSQTLGDVEGVESVHPRTAWFSSPRISVVFDTNTQPNEILRRMASALRSPSEHSESSRQAPSFATTTSEFTMVNESRNDASLAVKQDSSVIVDSRTFSRRLSVQKRLREWGYGILTIASFGMAWVGLIVPGIPTVPFVLLTAHFALQASPKLRARVVKSRMFGQMIRDWQEHGAIRRSVQIEAYLLTLLIIVVGLIFSPPVPIIYVGMAFGSVLGLYAVAQIPVIESNEDGEVAVKTLRFLKHLPANA